MSALVLGSVGPGFAAPVFESQAAFRGCLTALSMPGTVVSLGAGMEPLPGLHPAATALLLALLDQDTRLWLSSGAAVGATAMSLKFHTGCYLAASPAEADFALVASPAELPPLSAFSAGSQEYPERSATLLLQVPEIRESGWRLAGPGVAEGAQVCVPSLGVDFLQQWEANRARFPRGVDLYFCSGERLFGLPRSTRIHS